jgi:hypothetical protein
VAEILTDAQFCDYLDRYRDLGTCRDLLIEHDAALRERCEELERERDYYESEWKALTDGYRQLAALREGDRAETKRLREALVRAWNALNPQARASD